jgi:hypothetical protein
MTRDRRFSYLKGECRKWLDPEEIELELDQAQEQSRPELPDEESSHQVGSILTHPQPLARLGDVVAASG